MEVKELEQLRTRSQKITNILKEDFDFKWDGRDYTIKKGETQTHPFYLAEHAALHMARTSMKDNIKEFHKKGGEVVDKIMGKKFIDYNALKKSEAIALCEDRNISTEVDGKSKNKDELIQNLKDSH